MEYEGGTTTSTGALAHETFHSWYARGDQAGVAGRRLVGRGFTTFHDDGADEPPVRLHRPAGRAVLARPLAAPHAGQLLRRRHRASVRGMASLLGVTDLNALMGELLRDAQGRPPVSTPSSRSSCLQPSGNAAVVDAFHRFVYGLGDPAPAPDLWLRDDPAIRAPTPGAATFWDSPDLWVRNARRRRHHPPVAGVRPGQLVPRARAQPRRRRRRRALRRDLPCPRLRRARSSSTRPTSCPASRPRPSSISAPGATRVVKARWPRRSSRRPARTPACSPRSSPARTIRSPGRHVWEHNNLAQKNLTVVDLAADEFLILPVVIANLSGDDGYGLRAGAARIAARVPPRQPASSTARARSSSPRRASRSGSARPAAGRATSCSTAAGISTAQPTSRTRSPGASPTAGRRRSPGARPSRSRSSASRRPSSASRWRSRPAPSAARRRSTWSSAGRARSQIVGGVAVQVNVTG